MSSITRWLVNSTLTAVVDKDNKINKSDGGKTIEKLAKS